MRRGAVVLWVVWAGAAWSCGGDDGHADCDVAALQAQLDAASSGDTVVMQACAAHGEITVPAGVTLAGTDGARVEVDDGVGLRLEPSSDASAPTTVRSVDVRADGRVGILARGAGHVAIESLTIEASTGYGIGIESATSVALDGVALRGTITADNGGDAAFLTPDPGTMPTYGIAILAASEASVTNTTVKGFAEFGVVVLDHTSDGTAAAGPTVLSWTGGEVSDTLGTGVYLADSVATLTDLSVVGTLRGLRGLPSYAAVFTGDTSDVTSVRMRICDNADFGILQEGGAAHHTDLEVTANATGGLAAGSAMSLSLDGGGAIFADNGAFNIMVRDSRNVSIRDADISGAIKVPSTLSSSRELGDGIQMVQTYENVVLEDLTIRNNARAALVVDLGPDGGAGITFTNVMVHSMMADLGAGGGTVDTATWTMTPMPPDGMWDAGIVRDATSTMLDASFAGSLAVAGIVTPSMIPRPGDLAGIVTPSM